MEVIKFNLGGSFAFFKKPDVNTYLYFTFGNIHKIALLGVLGGILGYKGYNQQKNDIYPEFYSKLKDLKIAIVPKEINISKKVQTFNNSVGYASKEKGGNLIVKEQWLENPSWEIYIAIENEESKKLAYALKNSSFIYTPYLGKNDHLADITDINIVESKLCSNEVNKIDSLFIKEYFEFVESNYFDDLEYDEIDNIFKYEEKLPCSLEKNTNNYEYKNILFTNSNLLRVSRRVR